MNRPTPLRGQILGGQLTISSSNQHVTMSTTHLQPRAVNYGIASQIISSNSAQSRHASSGLAVSATHSSSATTTTITTTTTTIITSITPASVSSSFVKHVSTIKKEEKPIKEDPSEMREKIISSYGNFMEEIKCNFRDRLQELFFIQSGGNMVDFPAWKSRPNPHLLSFLNVYKLEDVSHSSHKTSSVNGSKQDDFPSATKPSQQLEQYGFVPGVNTTFPSSKSAAYGYKNLKNDLSNKSSIGFQNDNKSSGAITQDNIVGQVRQEAETIQRVAQLRKAGLWSASRLPKVYEQPHRKSHWDFLLEEMQWLATDFSQEKRWKRNMAKKVSRSILKFHQDKAASEKKFQKEEVIRLKRIANGIAKEVKQFWQQIEKVATYKQQSRQEEQRRKALDLHLNFIVDQTEKYSSWLVEGMRESTVSSPMSSKTDGDEVYQPEGEMVDDEQTISDEENQNEQGKYADELTELRKESEIPLEDLIQSLPDDMVMRLSGQNMNSAEKTTMSGDESDNSGSQSDGDSDETDKENVNDDDNDNGGDDDGESKKDGDASGEEYVADFEEMVDDEKTIDMEEEHGDEDYQTELADLQNESEIPIDELIKAYGPAGQPESNETSDQSDSSASEETEEETEEEEEEEEKGEEDGKPEPALSVSPERKMEETEKHVADEQLTNAAATAESLQPKGFTLSTTQVKTKIPFLLQHQLREYQHIGLDWLVTMYHKQLNGILADEMGLGKTIQTIALLAHLACEEECWGPHLIVVPTSVMLNWEFEFKKWCPGFKILTYFGSQKERKMKRTGWSKPNAFHVCITSYKLVIQDHQAFRRRKWKYLILDEAQNIKNFKSQRWQMLLNFHSQRRLLLTGTPLQNSLMELWSLMHFLMPNIFQSHHDFKEWFSNPLTGMIEGSREYNEGLVKRLHTVLRPFLLRRLKSEVELQMPKKYEHVVKCRLSKRQRFLYDEFMSRTKTKETLAAGNFLSVINILMQLRKVCNHPDLFELRPTVSPFVMDTLVIYMPSIVTNALQYNPLQHINFCSLNLCLSDFELTLGAFQSHRTYQLKASQAPFQELSPCNDDSIEATKHGYMSSSQFQPLENISGNKRTVSPPTEGLRSYLDAMVSSNKSQSVEDILLHQVEVSLNSSDVDVVSYDAENEVQDVLLEPMKKKQKFEESKEVLRSKLLEDYVVDNVSPFFLEQIKEDALAAKCQTQKYMTMINDRHCDVCPVYGTDLHEAVRINLSNSVIVGSLLLSYQPDILCNTLQEIVKCPVQRLSEEKPIMDRYYMYIHPILVQQIDLRTAHFQPSMLQAEKNFMENLETNLSAKTDYLLPIVNNSLLQFPETRLVQYDCGKLQALDQLLRKLKSGKHRVLIFTQMTKMLDVLERFLNYHGYIYLRLDGTTKVEQRQVLMERFNQDEKIFCFILSTRSGGIGVNLTGADTVVFYDSDWNPTMDAQAQDRCHRIGQTRDVHIYRLICDRTVEENILKKAHQKRMLGNLAIEGGKFTAEFFKQESVRDLFNVSHNADEEEYTKKPADNANPEQQPDSNRSKSDGNVSKRDGSISNKEFEEVLSKVEEEEDVKAACQAKAEEESELTEFNENVPYADDTSKTETSKVEQALALLESELKPVEKFALRFMESTNIYMVEDEVEETEKILEQRKKDWELDHLQSLKEAEERRNAEEEDDMLFTYVRDETYSKHFIDDYTGVVMPVWAPPTPPQDNEIDYVPDYCLAFLYETDVIPDNHLPPTHYLKKCGMDLYAMKRSTNRTHYLSSFKKKRLRISKPKSIFDKKALELLNKSKLKKSQKLKQKAMTVPSVPSSISTRPDYSQHGPEWLISEDWALLQAINTMSELPLDFHNEPVHNKLANWELAADIVNSTSRIRRSARQCRDRYQNVILLREEGKLMTSNQSDSNESKLKKNKKNLPHAQLVKAPTTAHPQAKTHVQFNHDHGKSVVSMHNSKFESVKRASGKRKSNVKQPGASKYQSNRHAQILTGNQSVEPPKNPKELATLRAERIAKEKAQAVVAAQQQQQQQQQASSTNSVTTQNQTVLSMSTRPVLTQATNNSAASQLSKNSATSGNNATGGNLVFTSSSAIGGSSLVVNPSVASNVNATLVTTSASFAAINRKMQNVVHNQGAGTISGATRILPSQSQVVGSHSPQILPGLITSKAQTQSGGAISSTPSSVVAPNLVAQVQRGATIPGTIGTGGSLITTQPFIQGKQLTQHQIALLRQKAAQQQQLQKIQQQQRLQQQKQQQQLKIIQQQQQPTSQQQTNQSQAQTLQQLQSQQSTNLGNKPTIVATSNQLGGLTVQTLKNAVTLSGSSPQQMMTQSLTTAQQQQLLQQALKKQQLQHLQQRATSGSQIQQMLAGQKLTQHQLQQLQQQQQRHSQIHLQQQQLKFQQQVTASIVTQPKAQLVMTPVKPVQQGVQSIKTPSQQIQLQQLQQSAAVQGSLPQQILLRPTLTQGLPQSIQLRAMISQQSPQQLQRVQAMQAQVNLQTGTVVMHPTQVSSQQQQQLTQVQVVSSLAQQQQRNIQAAVQKQVQQQQQQQQQQRPKLSSATTPTSKQTQVQLQLQSNLNQFQRQQVLSATPAQLSQVKAFVSQAQLQASLNRANALSTSNTASTLNTSSTVQTPSIQLQAQQVSQQIRNQAQLVHVQLKVPESSGTLQQQQISQQQQQQLKQQQQQQQLKQQQLKQQLQQLQAQAAKQQQIQKQQSASNSPTTQAIVVKTRPQDEQKTFDTPILPSSSMLPSTASHVLSTASNVEVETLGAETELSTEEGKSDDPAHSHSMRTRSHKPS